MLQDWQTRSIFRPIELGANFQRRTRYAMAAVLLRDRIGEHGRILVVGAGGGVELSVFARECQGWTFTGVDPSVEMLQQAKVKLENVGASDRVSWVQGGVENSPVGPFDAATAFLALNFVPDDGRRTRHFARDPCATKIGRTVPDDKWLLGQELAALRG